MPVCDETCRSEHEYLQSKQQIGNAKQLNMPTLYIMQRKPDYDIITEPCNGRSPCGQYCVPTSGSNRMKNLIIESTS